MTCGPLLASNCLRVLNMYTRALVVGLLLIFPTVLPAQTNEVPLETCDVLPVVKVRLGSTDMRFLVDTGATTLLNLRSFTAGKLKDIQITSWSGTTFTNAREISLPEITVGTHHFRDLKLPAIDLSPIGKACGGPIDGILGVDLLDKMEITIDLKRRILASNPSDPNVVYADMEGSMHSCVMAFNAGKAAEFEDCLDPNSVMYTADGEFVGRKQVVKYLSERFFKYAPDLSYKMKMHQVQTYGNAVWYSYEYSIDTPKEHLAGHGFAMCCKNGSRWQMLNLHNSPRL